MSRWLSVLFLTLCMTACAGNDCFAQRMGSDPKEEPSDEEKPGRGEKGPEKSPEEKESDAEKRSHDRATKGFARYMETKDKNADGKLSADELPNVKNFADLDKNKDGFLDETEYVNGKVAQDRENRRKSKERAATRPRRGPERSALTQFTVLDRNHDGKLTAEEHPALFEKEKLADLNGDGGVNLEEFEFFMEGQEQEKSNPFDAMDADKNGTLSSEEAAAFLKENPDADGDKNGELTRAEYDSARNGKRAKRRAELAKTPAQRLMEKDKDKNGKVSVEEAEDLVKRFPGLDADKDGVVTADEYKRALESQAGSMRESEPFVKQFLVQFDKDHDGVLTGEETKLALARHPELDANSDGTIDRAEIEKLLPPPGQRQAPGDALRFERFDKDGDGKISKEEQADFFRMGMDKNQDEMIDREEFEARFAGRGKRKPGESGGEKPEKPMGGGKN